MWPAPCSWRTRMWRIERSSSGSYTGRMQPPGKPKITSTCFLSRLLMRAWAPVSRSVMSVPLCRVFVGECSVWSWWKSGPDRTRCQKQTTSVWEVGTRSGRPHVLDEYYEQAWECGSGRRHGEHHSPSSVRCWQVMKGDDTRSVTRDLRSARGTVRIVGRRDDVIAAAVELLASRDLQRSRR